MSQASWRIETTPGFLRELRKLDRPVAVRVLAYLHEVVELGDPRLRGKALTGNRVGQWRYRIGDHRVIVQIVDERITILALTVGHRSAIY